jgi:NAD(P)-dependent dehydrogenase (short-subunit alcohol dehydrogenase family)
VVVGCRTECGHQVALKLLRAGSRVVGTSRQPERAIALFRQYDDSDRWLANLDVYEQPLDFSLSQLREPFAEFAMYVAERYSFVTNVVFCAGQSVAPAERIERKLVLFNGCEVNRYGDLQFARANWDQTIYGIRQDECEQSMRVNGVAPALFFQALFPLMRKAPTVPFFVSAHAYEGLFTVLQNARHIHANMGKTARAMLTRCLPEHRMRTDSGLPFAIHGVDPGCFSVDEYSEGDRIWIVPPLDEIDAAARMLYPIFMKLDSSKKTRRNFIDMLY